MLLIDDLLLAPIKGVMWICKEILEAAEQDRAAEGDRIKDRLRELYMLLETQQITEQAFDDEERVLLDRLDELEAEGAARAADADAAAEGNADDLDDAGGDGGYYEGDEDDEAEGRDAEQGGEDREYPTDNYVESPDSGTTATGAARPSGGGRDGETDS